MGENICKWYVQLGINTQNIQTAHKTQYQKKKQLQNSKTWKDVFPNKTYRWPIDIWKDFQHY